MTDSSDLPDYLAENPDGSVTVKLRKRYTFNGAETRDRLTLREPTVNDQLVTFDMAGSNGVKEVALVANLAEIAPADVHSLTLRDYARVQRALGFLNA